MRGWRFDLWSFLIGFLTSGLLLFLAYRFRDTLHALWHSFRQALQNILPVGSNIEIQFRKDLIRFSQKEHLLSKMFPLDELLIPSRVIPLIPAWDKKQELHFEDITTEAVPLLFDDPLFASLYRTRSFSLLEILSKGNSHLILLGEPGTGKTTALLETAMTIARCSHSYENLHTFLPLYLHASRLHKEIEKKSDILNSLVEAARGIYSNPVRRSLLRLVRKAAREHRLILFIDGLDEIPPQKFDELSDFIKVLSMQHPEIKIVLAVSPNYLSDFVSMGFSPLLLCLWDKNDTKTFLKRWSFAWQNSNLATEEDIALWTAWARQEVDLLTPLEWTLFLLLLFLKLPTLHRPQILIESSLNIAKLEPNSKKEIAQWAYQTILNALQNKTPPSPPIAMEKLISDEIFVKASPQEIHFTSPIFLSLFASYATLDREQISSLLQSQWEVAALAARLASTRSDGAPFTSHSTEFTRDQLNDKIRFLTYISPDSEAKRNLLKLVVNLITNEQEPKYLRAKLFSTVLCSRIEERPQVAKFLLQSKDPFSRQLGALGYGLLKNAPDLQPLLQLLQDPLPNCFQAACLSLVNLGTSAALDAVIGALLHGHDRLKDAAAQSLANDPAIGHAIIREATTHEDPRVRKAAISGLLRIEAPWAIDTLKRMAIEAELWIEKDAAANALTFLESPNPNIPQKRPEPANLSWLIQFAAQKGIGLIPGKPNNEILLRALEDGDSDTRIAVLSYLLFNPFDLATPLIENLLNSPDPEVQSAAYQTLRSFSVCRNTSP